MITFKTVKNLVEIHPEGKVAEMDFGTLAYKVDKLIEEYGSIYLLADVRELKGWNSFAALRAHLRFVKDRHSHVERAAIITGPLWQKGMASIIRLFLHPQVRMFHPNDLKAAKAWLRGDK